MGTRLIPEFSQYLISELAWSFCFPKDITVGGAFELWTLA